MKQKPNKLCGEHQKIQFVKSIFVKNLSLLNLKLIYLTQFTTSYCYFIRNIFSKSIYYLNDYFIGYIKKGFIQMRCITHPHFPVWRNTPLTHTIQINCATFILSGRPSHSSWSFVEEIVPILKKITSIVQILLGARRDERPLYTDHRQLLWPQR